MQDRIMWTRNIRKVYDGMNLTDNDDQIHLMKEMCDGQALTALKVKLALPLLAMQHATSNCKILLKVSSLHTKYGSRRNSPHVLHEANRSQKMVQ
jgi:hypothetical protein